MNVNQFWHDGYALVASILGSLLGRVFVAFAVFVAGLGCGGWSGKGEVSGFGEAVTDTPAVVIESMFNSYGFFVLPIVFALTWFLMKMEARLPWFLLILPFSWFLGHEVFDFRYTPRFFLF